jgi:glutamyl-Q tRNA(Asp) synthetase
MGSLVAAVGSYLSARSRGGEWLVRMEDVDTPRTVPGAADEILRTLEGFGFEWDGPVLFQSTRTEAYREAFEELRRAGAVFPCRCSRREIVEGRYPGTCRAGPRCSRSAASWRVRVYDRPISFRDRIWGAREERLESSIGDFVVLRADGLFAYQLAVVVDDAAQGVTEVVRGADLLDSTGRQIHLQRLLGLPTPEYAHLPVIRDEYGEKLSKQTGARAVEIRRAGEELFEALLLLGQRPEAALRGAPVEELWQWAAVHWREKHVPC